MTRVLVTGGMGFIGTHTVRMLRSLGYDVTILDYARKSGVDLRNECMVMDFVQRVQPDVVVHLAAKKAGDKLEMLWTNVAGTKHLMQACLSCESVKQVIYASSAAVYGHDMQVEDAVCEPTSLYGETKLKAERILLESSLAVTAFRFFNIYGQGGNGVVNIIDDCRKTGSTLHVFNGGVRARDYVPVSFIATAICHAISEPPVEQIVNLGSGCGLSVTRLVQLARTVGPLDVMDDRQSTRVDTYNSVADTAVLLKWCKTIGWTEPLHMHKAEWEWEVCKFWKPE